MGERYLSTADDLEWETLEEGSVVDTPGEIVSLLDVEEPVAKLVRIEPNEALERHYHDQDQWQVILEGSCTIDGTTLEPYAVVYTEKNTPYGPMTAGDDGLLFLDLREHQADHFPVEDS